MEKKEGLEQRKLQGQGELWRELEGREMEHLVAYEVAAEMAAEEATEVVVEVEVEEVEMVVVLVGVYV